jgi:hypothetical protein
MLAIHQIETGLTDETGMSGTREMPGLYLRVDAYPYCTRCITIPEVCRSLAAQPVMLGATGLNLKQSC